MARVSEILRGKGADVLKIEASATVFDAIKKIVDKNVGSILVTEGDEVVGIMTERDYLRKIIVLGRTSHETLVSEIMTAPLVYVTPETTIEESMAIMTDRRDPPPPGRGERGRRRHHLDRRSRQVPVARAELPDPVPDRLHLGPLVRAPGPAGETVLHLSVVAKAVEQRDSVVIRFAGDSGDGMQLTGGQFTSETAMLGNDLSTFPDYPRRDPRARRIAARRLGLPAPFRRPRHPDAGRPAGRARRDEPGRAEDESQGSRQGRHADREQGRVHRAQPRQGRLHREPARGRLARRVPGARRRG